MALAEQVPKILGQLGELGLVCIVKVDGERKHKRWTVVITGVPLGERLVRVDGNSLDYCLTKALASLHEMLPELPTFD